MFFPSPPLITIPRKNRPNFSNESCVPVIAQTEGEVHFLAQALDYYRAVQRAGRDAPFGQFLNHADAAVQEKGRELLRASLENIVQTEIDEVEKKKILGPVRSAKRKQGISDTVTRRSTLPAET